MPTFEEILAEAEAAVARNKARVGKGNGRAAVERAEDPARENLYIPHRNVYNWFHNVCACGRSWLEFDGIYEERRHPRLGHTHWVRLPAIPTNNLPRAREARAVSVPYCQECANATPEATEPQPEVTRIPSTGDNRQTENLLR